MTSYQRYMVLFILFTLSGFCLLTLAVDRVQLRDVDVLTLYDGKMTTGRRSSPVPQLRCTGGSARCSFMPKVVQCYNRGSDGYETQWECKTDMDNKYRFGNIQVSCEGYDYPDDPYILQGSCGLEYTIDFTDEGYEKQRSSGYRDNSHHHGQGNYYHTRTVSRSKSTSFGDVFMLIIVGVIFYMIYKTCATSSNQVTNDTVPPTAPPTAPPPYPEQPGFRSAYTQGPPPPYTPGFKREHTQGSTPGSGAGTSNSGTSNYGFWSGAASGGLFGYLFGRNSGTRHYNTPYPGYHSNQGSGLFGNWFGGRRSHSYGPSSSFFSSSSPSSSRSSSRSSSGTRTSSGFGGTSRR